MTTPHYLLPGDQTLLRYRRLGPVSIALPVTVVRDDPEVTMLFLRSGTPIKRRVLADGSVIPRDMPYAERAALPHLVGDATWHSHHQRRIHFAGEAHSTSLFWSDIDWTFTFYYVDLETPTVRRGHAFDTADHVLDIVVEPDLAWRWKDEDEFTTAIEIGRFSPEEAIAIRTEGERALQRVVSRSWPFDGSLESWRPPAEWPVPTVPDTWNED